MDFRGDCKRHSPGRQPTLPNKVPAAKHRDARAKVKVSKICIYIVNMGKTIHCSLTSFLEMAELFWLKFSQNIWPDDMSVKFQPVWLKSSKVLST